MCASLSTYDSARGLSLGRHSELLSTSHAGLSTAAAFPFLDASASICMEAALFFLPPLGESCFPPPPRPRRRRSEFRRLRTSRPKCPYGGGHFWSPWPSSWTSSPVPGRSLEPASSSEVGLLGFRAAEPDTGSAPPLLSSPEKINGEA